MSNIINIWWRLAHAFRRLPFNQSRVTISVINPHSINILFPDSSLWSSICLIVWWLMHEYYSLSANCYRSLKLCTVVLYRLNYRKIQGVKNFKWGHTHFGHAHLLQLTRESKNHNSASEGHTESIFSSKEPQWSSLYSTC